jgi:hypothetical protein
MYRIPESGERAPGGGTETLPRCVARGEVRHHFNLLLRQSFLTSELRDALAAAANLFWPPSLLHLPIA